MTRPRIIGGTAKGRALETPRHGTRLSSSRLREALFDIVAFEPRGRFLDLYAGSGAVGLEAASRGFEAVCVELSPQAAAVIERNARNLGLRVEVVRGDALAYARAHAGEFDVAHRRGRAGRLAGAAGAGPEPPFASRPRRGSGRRRHGRAAVR